MTAFERRKLGLSKLPRDGLTYDDFKDINKLWIGYMTELLPSLKDRKLAWDGPIIFSRIGQQIAKEVIADFESKWLVMNKNIGKLFTACREIVFYQKNFGYD